jgi:transcriptional regulator with XRE-family HTH domain
VRGADWAVEAVARPTVTVPRLREHRVAAFLSQEELGKRSGVSVSAIIRLEHGGAAELGTVRKLAEALGVEPRALTAPRPADEPP